MALPVLFLGRGSVSIDASNGASAVGVVAPADDPVTTPSSDAPSSDATASSLLETVDRDTLLDGGADPAAALELQREHDAESATTILVSPQATSSNRLSSVVTGSPAYVAEQVVATEAPAPTSASPVTDASSTSTPTTAAPTTAAPTTAAPTTAAPTTAAPTTAAPSVEAPVEALPAETGDPESTSGDTAEATSEPVDAPAGIPSADDWAALRACESFGDYGIVSSNGLYHGAYQFSVATWNATATAAGRNDLVGVLPSEASPADQDALALNLWSRRGFAPWPHCGRGLG